MSVKVDIISGFLGAGKTTMIKKLLDEDVLGEGIAIIENDFGDINIDADRLSKSGVEIKTMSSGCICCTLSGNFLFAIKQLIKEHSPKRIIIEPTGIGRLSDIIVIVEKAKKTDDIMLNVAMTVVDVSDFEDFIEILGPFFEDQIQSAKTVVLSKSHLVDEIAVNNVIDAVRKYNPKANIIATPWDELNAKDILSIAEAEECDQCNGVDCLHSSHEVECVEDHEHDHNHGQRNECVELHNHSHEHVHDHDNGNNNNEDSIQQSFEYLSFETMKKYTQEELKSILNALNDSIHGEVFRAKGSLLNFDKRWIDFDFVPKKSNMEYGKIKTIGQVTVIGRKLNKNSIRELF